MSPFIVTLSAAVRGQIQELLDAWQLTQTQLAKDLGVSQSAVSYVLSGGRRGRQLDLWNAIAGRLGYPLSALIQKAEARVTVRIPQPKSKRSRSSLLKPSGVPEQNHPSLVLEGPDGRSLSPDVEQLAELIAARINSLQSQPASHPKQATSAHADLPASGRRVRAGRRARA